MAYISAITVDFGSTNSGCCRTSSFDNEGNLVYTQPIFLHNTGYYAKDETWFYIEPSFLNRIENSYQSLHDEDFRILSRVFPNTENPNILWGREVKKRYAQKIKDENWVSFKRFKMMLYSGERTYTGMNFPLLLIIKTYLRVLKLECMALESRRMERPVSEDEIQWGVTIPSIWTDDNKNVMGEIAREVFNSDTRILSEPEGPLVYSILASNEKGRVDFVNGRITFVVDCGGGTTDICLMREVQNRKGDFHVEMVDYTDGSAAGGNDIDNNFYKFLLRHISSQLTDDNGIAYDSLTDEALYDSLFAGFQNQTDLFVEFEDNWYRLKNRDNIINLTDGCPFQFTPGYKKWLEKNGHSTVAARVGNYLSDGCYFDSSDFYNKVFDPTFNKICQKVKEILENNINNINIDRIVLAGGLSCNQLLDSKLKLFISNILGNHYKDKFAGLGEMDKGGAIMAGANYMLLHKDFIIRLAKKNYYFDVATTLFGIVAAYNKCGVEKRIGDINEMMQNEAMYSTKPIALLPIAIKGKLISNYVNGNLYTDDTQTKLNIVFYSSVEDHIVFANLNNPKLSLETEFEIDCEPNHRYRLEVDFNNAQVSNDLYYEFIDYETNQIVASGFIKDAATN